jgi:hypothetical protein
MDFIWGRVWALKSLSSVVSVNRVDARGWLTPRYSDFSLPTLFPT